MEDRRQRHWSLGSCKKKNVQGESTKRVVFDIRALELRIDSSRPSFEKEKLHTFQKAGAIGIH
jgi:hypothetical protein